MQQDQHHRVDYIEFQAKDIAAVRKFYADAFGWKFTDYGPDYTSFEDGRLAGGFSKGTPKGTGTLVVLYSKTLESSLSTVKKCGGTIVKEIFSFPGGRRFHFTDPGGNELAIWSDK